MQKTNIMHVWAKKIAKNWIAGHLLHLLVLKLLINALIYVCAQPWSATGCFNSIYRGRWKEAQQYKEKTLHLLPPSMGKWGKAGRTLQCIFLGYIQVNLLLFTDGLSEYLLLLKHVLNVLCIETASTKIT